MNEKTKQVRRRNVAFNLAMAIFIAFAMIGLSLLLLGEPSQAAPEAIPTPLSNPAVSDDALNFTFWASETLTADTGSSGIQLAKYEILDLQYVVDIHSTVNTSTFRLDFSNDPLCVSTPAQAVWSTGANIVASVASDSNGVVQMNNFARCVRAYGDVTNSQPVTVTLRGVAK